MSNAVSHAPAPHVSAPQTVTRSGEAASAQTAVPSIPDRAPFRWTKRDQHALPVRSHGSVPSWLRGQLLRTAPAVFDMGAFRADHWFDGLGLIYGFTFGEQVRFQQRLLDCEHAREIAAGRIDIATFATPMKRGFFSRLTHPVPKFTDNANVNIVPWQGQWLALTETPLQHVVGNDDLASRGLAHYDDKLPGNNTAHPQFDFERNAMISLSVTYGRKNEVWITRQSAHSNKRELEGKLAFKRVPYIHAFGLSPKHAVLIDHPFSVNPLAMLFSDKGFIDHFKWQPERGTRLCTLQRDSGVWTEHETEALFCFHVVNQFDDGQDVVLDFLAYDDARTVAALSASSLTHLRGLPYAPRLVRARLTPGKKHVELEQLSDERFEFPNIPYRAQNGHRYSTAWGASIADAPDAVSSWPSQVVRLDLESDRVTRFSEPHMTYGEPVFVPRPGASRPDDGVLLTVGSHAQDERSVLAILDATTLEPVARCEVELSLPLGFHGNYRAG